MFRIGEGFPTYYDICWAKFLISHDLECKKSGLVMASHNELCYRVADLAGKAFNPSHVRDNPLIYSGRAVKRTKASPARETATAVIQQRQRSRKRRDNFLSDTSVNRRPTVHDMRFVNTHAPTYQRKEPEKCLHEAERGKKNMYLEACLQQR